MVCVHKLLASTTKVDVRKCLSLIYSHLLFSPLSTPMHYRQYRDGQYEKVGMSLLDYGMSMPCSSWLPMVRWGNPFRMLP